MIKTQTAISGLRYLCVLVMTVGLMAMIDGLFHYRTIPLYIFDVPGWIIGASAAYMGLRYWRRIPEMEKKLQGSRFSWSNFSIFKAR